MRVVKAEQRPFVPQGDNGVVMRVVKKWSRDPSYLRVTMGLL
jgi:hypothetical protein